MTDEKFRKEILTAGVGNMKNLILEIYGNNIEHSKKFPKKHRTKLKNIISEIGIKKAEKLIEDVERRLRNILGKR